MTELLVTDSRWASATENFRSCIRDLLVVGLPEVRFAGARSLLIAMLPELADELIALRSTSVKNS